MKILCLGKISVNLELTIQKSWFTLPPVWEWYYKQHHPEYSPLPPFKPGCGEDALQSMQFIYPPMNARIVLPKQMDGSPGFLTAELAHGNPDTTIFWNLFVQKHHLFEGGWVCGRHGLDGRTRTCLEEERFHQQIILIDIKCSGYCISCFVYGR